MKRHSSWAAASIVAATFAVTAFAGTLRSAPNSAASPSSSEPATAAAADLRGLPGDVGAGVEQHRRHGERAVRELTPSGEALEIAVLSPDYAAQPAAKEAIDLFEAAAEAHGHTVTVVDTNSDNAAMNAELTTAVSQGVDAIVVAFGTPAGVRRRPRRCRRGGHPGVRPRHWRGRRGHPRQRHDRQPFPRRAERPGDHRRDRRGRHRGDDPLRPVRAGAPARRGGEGAVRGERHRDHRVRPGRPRGLDRVRQRRRRRPPRQVSRKASSTRSGPGGTPRRSAPTRRRSPPTAPRSSSPASTARSSPSPRSPRAATGSPPCARTGR